MTKYKQQDEDDENETVNSNQLGYFRKTRAFQVIEVPIDEEIKSPSYYRNISQAIRDAGEHDVIQFIINSPGGRLDGLETLLSSIWMSEASTEAYILGECHSAASILVLNCDSVFVSPCASMLVHSIRFGAAGKGADVLGHVDHVYKSAEKLFRETYAGFLSDTEMNRVLDGYEMWLDADEINRRLNLKLDYLKQEQEELVEEVIPAVKPKKTKK